MADLIKIKGGNGAVPALQDRELGYSKTEKALYIGTEGENVLLYSANDTTRIDPLIEEVKGIQATLTAINSEIETINTAIEDITARLDTTSE